MYKCTVHCSALTLSNLGAFTLFSLSLVFTFIKDETQGTLPGASPLRISWSVGPSFLSLGPILPTLVPPFIPFQLDKYLADL